MVMPCGCQGLNRIWALDFSLTMKVRSGKIVYLFTIKKILTMNTIKNSGASFFFHRRHWLAWIIFFNMLSCPVYAFGLWGEKPHNQVYLGMWTYHFFNPERYQSNNKLIGLQYNGYFVGGFSNSFGKPSFAAGLARTFYSQSFSKDIHLELGYRVGAMTGYRNQIDIAKYTGLMPFAQMNLGLSYKQIGTEFTWSGPVASVSFFWRLN